MVDTATLSNNGTTPPPPPVTRRVLPEVIHISAADAQRIPSPGTQRALKAETGKTWDVLVGPDAESADRFQTMIWIHLRREIPDLRWTECDETEVQIDDIPDDLDPTKLGASETSPVSAGSGA